MAVDKSVMDQVRGKGSPNNWRCYGIGEAAARLFCRHGAKVVIADFQNDLGKKVADDLRSSSTNFVRCDVTNESDVENAVNSAVHAFGKLDILYNNAGIGGEPKTSILESTQSDFDRVLRVNLVAYFLGVMIPNRSGSIVMTASIAGTIAGFTPHAYATSKFGVVGLTKNVAVELGNYGIRVNCISPYMIDTSLARGVFGSIKEGAYTLLNGRVLGTEDVAEAALYLASDEAKYVSGHNLVVDGGFSTMNEGVNVFAQSK